MGSIPAKVAWYNKGQQCGRVSVRIIHGLTLVLKNSYTYCKSILALEAKYYYTCSQDWQELTIAGSRPPLIRKAIKKSTSCNKFGTQLLPYVHATGLANFNTSISQIHNYSTSMTLISPSSYLKTIIKYRTSHSIRCILYDSFYYTYLGC